MEEKIHLPYYISVEKNLLISGPIQFKLVLFRVNCNYNCMHACTCVCMGVDRQTGNCVQICWEPQSQKNLTHCLILGYEHPGILPFKLLEVLISFLNHFLLIFLVCLN